MATGRVVTGPAATFRMNVATLPVFLAAFVPLFALVIAVWIDRKRRKETEKPPQQEKLLRPPGYSLALRLDVLQGRVMTHVLARNRE